MFVQEEVEKRAVTRRLMTHPGVGPLTALAYELVIGTPERFHCGKQLASYVGLVPEEKSSGDRRRLGHISKQGNLLLRFLLVEAAQVTVRSRPEWRNQFFHLAMRRGRKIAKVAMARKLAVHLQARHTRRFAGHLIFWTFIVVFTGLWLLSFNGAPPPSVHVLVTVDLILFSIVLGWAYWIDRLRQPNETSTNALPT